MQQAAQALRQAGQQMSKPMGPSNPGEGAQPGGDLSRELPGLAGALAAGKRWGELPGELRTKLIQDVKAKYGDDYARTIKFYFEQIADRK
jgi:hypothetical protein